MAALLGIFTLLVSFFRDLKELFSDSQGRALLLWVLILLVFGSIFFSVVEDWTLVDSFYFSVVTLTTVGYGDFSPTTPGAKLMTTVYIFFGLSIIAVFASHLAKTHAQRTTRKLSKRKTNQAPINDDSIDQ
jgi:uncharacterized membrane protein